MCNFETVNFINYEIRYENEKVLKIIDGEVDGLIRNGTIII